MASDLPQYCNLFDCIPLTLVRGLGSCSFWFKLEVGQPFVPRHSPILIMARSLVLTGAVLLCSGALFSAFVPVARAPVSAPATNAGTAAALSAAVLATPQAAFAEDGSVWIPALSAIGAGFAIGLASQSV